MDNHERVYSWRQCCIRWLWHTSIYSCCIYCCLCSHTAIASSCIYVNSSQLNTQKQQANTKKGTKVARSNPHYNSLNGFHSILPSQSMSSCLYGYLHFSKQLSSIFNASSLYLYCLIETFYCIEYSHPYTLVLDQIYCQRISFALVPLDFSGKSVTSKFNCLLTWWNQYLISFQTPVCISVAEF